jgi:hypothetical protein
MRTGRGRAAAARLVTARADIDDTGARRLKPGVLYIFSEAGATRGVGGVRRCVAI